MAKKRPHRATGQPVGRPRTVKVTPAKLAAWLPHRITDPTEWETLPEPDASEAIQGGAPEALATELLLDGALAEAQQTATRTTWTEETSEQIVLIAAVAQSVRRAVRRVQRSPALAPVFDHDAEATADAAMTTWLARLWFQRRRFIVGADPDDGAAELIYTLTYCLVAQEAAEAEIRRRAAEHPGYLTAWLAIEMRDEQERIERRTRGELEPPVPARLAEHARAARDYLAKLFVDRAWEGRLLHGYIVNHRLLDVLDADEPAASTRTTRIAGALYEQLSLTLGNDWANQEKYSDYAILADGLAGKLDGEPTKLTRRMVDRARPRWEQLKREVASEEIASEEHRADAEDVD